ncbi:MAG: hypothetical protein ABJN22_06365 [Litorimonas sp.]
MTDSIIRAPKFDFGAAITQIFNLPGGKGYLFRVVGFATLLLTVAFVLFGIPIVKSYVAMFQSIATMEATTGMSEAEELAAVMATMQPMFASMGWFSLLYIAQIGLYISVETALYRNIILGEDKGFFPLRFGGDEFRVLVTRIVVAFILYAAFFVLYFGLIILGAMVFGLGSAAESTAVYGIVALFAFLSFVAFIGGMVYVAIRLAPSAAFAVRDEDFTPVGSWGTMKTYFWPTFGAVLVVGLIGYIGLVVLSLLAFGLLFVSSGIFPLLMELDVDETPDFTPLLDLLSSAGFIIPAILITLVFTFLGLLYYGAIWSIWGYIAKLTDRQKTLNEYG